MTKTLREASAAFVYANETPTFQDIQTGCLQRIADSTELMAKNYRTMQQDRDRYEKWFNEKRAECERLAKAIIGMRGQIGKLKARARKAEGREDNA